MQAHKTVLCVDDDRSVLTATRALLEYKGYEVITVDTGQRAIDHVCIPFDLVIVDYNLPDFNGDVVAECWKQKHPAVPILMLSGSIDLPEHALDHVNAHLMKGVGIDSFFGVVSDLTESVHRVAPYHSAA
jgi:DNA-binding response OmpR family regulator